MARPIGTSSVNFKSSLWAGSIALALLIITIAAQPTDAQAGSPSVDRDALVALYEATDGPNWKNNSNWISDEPLGAWHGVWTDVTGQVTDLDLQDNQLTGEIPAELGNLTNLRRLDLWGNQLTGEIPAELGGLVNLGRLVLGGNQLTGEIPAELGDLANLRQAWLRSNRFTGKIPTELGKLANLQALLLSDNQLTGEIPADLGRLNSLSLLSLRDNQLTGEIPADFLNLTNLRWLDLRDNRLNGEIPTELGGLVNLESLYLDGNQLTGEIPAALGDLSNLQELALSDNQLSGDIPVELTKLNNLRKLFIKGNALTGCIPRELRDGVWVWVDAGLPFCDLLLNDLIFSPGSLTPSFDPHRAHYTAVVAPLFTVLTSSYQDTTVHFLDEDSVEMADADLTTPGFQIDFLDEDSVEMADADLTIPGFQIGIGPVSSTIRIKVVTEDGAATHTYTVEVILIPGAPTIHTVKEGGGYLSVSWTAPEEAAGVQIASYDLRYIMTTADETVDSNWTVSRNVRSAMTDTDLQYPITGLSAGAQYEIQVKAVDHGGLSGLWSAAATGVPSTPSVCVTGGSVTDVTNSGIISDCETLLAARDILAGDVALNWSPNTPMKDWDSVAIGGTPLRVASLSANNKGLNGTIPAELGDLAGLQQLNLAQNRLAGSIPAELGELVNLRMLDFSANRLTGRIPSQIGRLRDLRSLLLQGNEFTGVVPPELGGLHNLVEVDLSDNDLLGCPPQVWGVRISQIAVPACFAAEGMGFTVETSYLQNADLLRITAVGDAVNGMVTLDGSTINYVHDGSETTAGSFTYTVSDGTHSATVQVNIIVSPVNDPPVAVEDALAVLEGATVAVQTHELLANDFDAEADALSVTTVAGASNGYGTLDGTTIIYAHDGSETTVGSFIYTVSDGTDSATGLVNIIVSPVNDPPVAGADKAAVSEGGALLLDASELLANDSDFDSETLSVVQVSNPVNGIVRLDGAIIIYEHDGSETTTGGFSYTASDGSAQDTASVVLDVIPVNDPPVAGADRAAVSEGGALLLDASELLANDTDLDSETLSVVQVSNPVNGIVRLDGAIIIYEHDGSETTTGGFSYTASDGSAQDTASVVLDVTPVNDSPVAGADRAAVSEGGALLLDASELLANDTDLDSETLSVVQVSNPVNGIVRLDGAIIIYEHDGSETTTGGFTYTASDGSAQDTGSVILDVSLINDTLPQFAIGLLIGVVILIGGVLVVVLLIKVRRSRGTS